MRKLVALLIIMAGMLGFASLATAHPGNTDSSGGHTCRTNCTEKWGLSYGEYHFHNGGEPVYNAQVERDNGYNVGYKKGYALGLEKAYDQSIEYSYPNHDYKEGWEDGFDEGFHAGVAQVELVEKRHSNVMKFLGLTAVGVSSGGFIAYRRRKKRID